MVNHSQISSKLKRVRDQFRTWNFHYTIQTNRLGEEGVSTDEKKFQTGTWMIWWIYIACNWQSTNFVFYLIIYQLERQAEAFLFSF